MPKAEASLIPLPFWGSGQRLLTWSSFVPGRKKCTATPEDKMMRSGGGRSQILSQLLCGGRRSSGIQERTQEIAELRGNGLRPGTRGNVRL